jgi:hypothetical protein
MPLWGNIDNAANSTIFAAAQVNKTPNSTNRTALFGNTTSGAFVSGATIGQFGFDTAEQQAVSGASGSAGPAHAGWVLRTAGTGGRAGRVFYETLVAMGSMSGDAEDVVAPDYRISITSQPAANTGNSTQLQVVTFRVAAATTPAGGTPTYLWQYTTDPGNTATWATTAAVSGFSNQTTTTLSVNTAIIPDNTLVRAVVSATGATSVTSSSAELTVVS